MTIWERNIAGPAMHAFVIGVAGYPDAKANRGYDHDLRAVRDVPCAVASARRVADWLFENRDTLTPPLASLDLLLSEAPPDPERAPYPMRLVPQEEIEPATFANVQTHGEDWQARFRPGDSAFFFISGHGAMSGNDAVVFLQDLNSRRNLPWGAHVNLTAAARALKGDPRLTAAYFFSDACQEYNERFAQVQRGDGAIMVTPQDPMLLDQARDKVAFITAASSGLDTLEGKWSEDSAVKMGRFTQVLIQALDGASARQLDGTWAVCTESLTADLKSLYRLRKDWTERFEPSSVLLPSDHYPIIIHGQPKVPIIVKTRPPERIPSCLLEIFKQPDRGLPAIQRFEPAPRQLWVVWLEASIWPHLIVATDSNAQSAVAVISPSQPIFGQTVAFS